MKRVFIDSSVLIASLLSSNGGSAVVLRMCKNKKIFGIISVSILEEVFEKSEKIGKSISEISSFIDECGLIIRNKVVEEEIKPYLGFTSDLDDLHVIAGAKLTKCEYLVTLDKKHLLALKTKKVVSPLKIISPKGFLEELTT